MMNEYLFGPFLSEYYLLEAIFGDYMSEAERCEMYFELSRIFCIPDCRELEEYREDSDLEHFRDVNDYAAYERLCRMVEFAEKSGQNIGFSKRDKMILAQKREAMIIKSEHFKIPKNMTRDSAASVLLSMAMNGNVDAMACLSYAEYHGICVCRDMRSALKRMKLCAKWNSLFGNLMGIAYDPENEKEYYDRLYTILRGESRKQVFEHICHMGDYTEQGEKNRVARIIEKAFSLGIVKRNQYDQLFAKIAYSEMISLEDKEKLLLNKQKDAILALSDIPFDSKKSGKLSFRMPDDAVIPDTRRAEASKILRNITVACECPADAYRPLLVVSPDEYVRDMYGSFIMRGFDESAVVKIDAGTLTLQDFAGTKENIFLRGMLATKTAHTVFVIKDCDEFGEQELEELIKLLDNEYRKRFKLTFPAVTFDLSDISFIMLASKRNSATRSLSELCDTVWAERISEAEKVTAVDNMIASRSALYGRKNVEIENGCLEYLVNCDTERARQIIDTAMSELVFEKGEMITLDMIKRICREEKLTCKARGFGYTGGEKHA